MSIDFSWVTTDNLRMVMLAIGNLLHLYMVRKIAYYYFWMVSLNKDDIKHVFMQENAKMHCQYREASVTLKGSICRVEKSCFLVQHIILSVVFISRAQLNHSENLVQFQEFTFYEMALNTCSLQRASALSSGGGFVFLIGLIGPFAAREKSPPSSVSTCGAHRHAALLQISQVFSVCSLKVRFRFRYVDQLRSFVYLPDSEPLHPRGKLVSTPGQLQSDSWRNSVFNNSWG